MVRPFLFAILLAFLTADVLVQAQVPTYQPYGAWRGRIHYVKGPFRTRSTIRWGNGITPVGGQVLMHGLTTAGNIFTNPDFLNALNNDGSQRETNKANLILRSDIEELQKQNAAIRQLLNDEVLEPWGLEKTEVATAAVNLGDVKVNIAAGVTEDIVNQLVDSVNENFRTMASWVFPQPAAQVAGYGKFLLGNEDQFPFNSDQKAAIVAVNKYAESLIEQAGQPSIPPADIDDLDKLFKDYMSLVAKLLAVSKTSRNAAELVIQAAGSLKAHGQDNSASNEALDIATTLKSITENIPDFNSKLFADFKPTSTSEVEQPSVEQPIVEQPSDVQPSDEDSGDEQPSDVQPSDEDSGVETAPADPAPSDE